MQIPSSMQQLSSVAFPGGSALSGVGNTAVGVLKSSVAYVAGGK